MYNIRFMNDKEFDALPYDSKDKMGICDRNTGVVFVRETGIPIADAMTTLHEIEHMDDGDWGKFAHHQDPNDPGVYYKSSSSWLAPVLGIAANFLIPGLGAALGPMLSGLGSSFAGALGSISPALGGAATSIGSSLGGAASSLGNAGKSISGMFGGGTGAAESGANYANAAAGGGGFGGTAGYSAASQYGAPSAISGALGSLGQGAQSLMQGAGQNMANNSLQSMFGSPTASQTPSVNMGQMGMGFPSGSAGGSFGSPSTSSGTSGGMGPGPMSSVGGGGSIGGASSGKPSYAGQVESVFRDPQTSYTDPSLMSSTFGTNQGAKF